MQWALALLSITIMVHWNLAKTQEPMHNKSAFEEAARNLDQLFQQKRYSELKRQLREAKVTPIERDYFEAILNDRCNQSSQAASKLAAR